MEKHKLDSNVKRRRWIISEETVEGIKIERYDGGTEPIQLYVDIGKAITLREALAHFGSKFTYKILETGKFCCASQPIGQ